MEDNVWFSPLNVIHHAHILRRQTSDKEKQTKRFKKVVEAYTVAQMLVGIMAIENHEYWLQVVDDKLGSPDIKTLRKVDSTDGKFDSLEQIDIEVVEYESHSDHKTIPEFILESKFSNKKSYDKDTVILCYVGSQNKEIRLPSNEHTKEVMNKIKTESTILLLYASDYQTNELELVSLKPNIGLLIKYDPVEVLKRKKHVGVAVFNRGSKKDPVYNPDIKHYPFESLGYIPNKDGNYII